MFGTTMPEPPHVLAIDLGTSGPKVALVSADGHIVGHGFEPVDLLLTSDGGAEQSPEDWWEAIGRASRRALASLSVPVDSGR